ncbi:hypothetical protein C0993_008431 [Termitomyces sp. T159_Od127]|nr:hypothetical protein C0993_008431 [Termitomyces sp. T159_Od127]
MDHDTSWCPVCDRAIQPKRLQVPVPPAQPPATPAPPPSPTSVRRTKTAARQRAGLVQGTGRVKPNGDLKPQPPQTRYRTVIDQGPTPLYCSNECHTVDQNRDVYRDSSRSSDASSVSTTADSPDSPPSPVPTEAKVAPSLVVMKEMYGWAPFPPPAPVDDVDPLDSAPPIADYDNGIIMTGRRIKSQFLPPPPKRDGRGNMVREPRKPIPGWTDGSNAWRSTVYNLSAPDASASVKYQPFVLRGSKGVQSTFSHPRQQVVSSMPSNVVSEEDRDRLDKFSQSFRRTSSCSPNAVPTMSSSSYPPSRKERPLVKRGAEGKLLVPNVMMRVNSHSSSTSLSSQWSSQGNARSPLSQESSSDDGEDIVQSQRCTSASSLRPPKRPTVETRSWSYDNVKTYPTMRIPKKTRIEKHKEKRIVDGQEVEVEVEVEVEEKPKCLFLFAPWTPTTPAACA